MSGSQETHSTRGPRQSAPSHGDRSYTHLGTPTFSFQTQPPTARFKRYRPCSDISNSDPQFVGSPGKHVLDIDLFIQNASEAPLHTSPRATTRSRLFGHALSTPQGFISNTVEFMKQRYQSKLQQQGLSNAIERREVRTTAHKLAPSKEYEDIELKFENLASRRKSRRQTASIADDSESEDDLLFTPPPIFKTSADQPVEIDLTEEQGEQAIQQESQDPPILLDLYSIQVASKRIWQTATSPIFLSIQPGVVSIQLSNDRNISLLLNKDVSEATFLQSNYPVLCFKLTRDALNRILQFFNDHSFDASDDVESEGTIYTSGLTQGDYIFCLGKSLDHFLQCKTHVLTDLFMLPREVSLEEIIDMGLPNEMLQIVCNHIAPPTESKFITRSKRRAQEAHASSTVLPVARKHAILTYPKNSSDSVTLYQSDIERLNPGEFLNDSIIDFYMRYIYHTKLSKHTQARIHFFSTFFWRALPTPSIRKWTRNVNIFDFDFILFPINMKMHWKLAVICFAGKLVSSDNIEMHQSPCMFIMDSLGGTPEKRIFNQIRKYLREEFESKTGSQLNISSEEFRGFTVDVPIQGNAIDCGVHVLENVAQFCSKLDEITEFSQPVLNAQFGTSCYKLQAISDLRLEMKQTIAGLVAQERLDGSGLIQEVALESLHEEDELSDHQEPPGVKETPGKELPHSPPMIKSSIWTDMKQDMKQSKPPQANARSHLASSPSKGHSIFSILNFGRFSFPSPSQSNPESDHIVDDRRFSYSDSDSGDNDFRANAISISASDELQSGPVSSISHESSSESSTTNIRTRRSPRFNSPPIANTSSPSIESPEERSPSTSPKRKRVLSLVAVQPNSKRSRHS